MESPSVTGVHKIWPNDGFGQLSVYCDQRSDGGGSLYVQPAQQGIYIYLIVPFWYASAAYQASLVEPWFVLWQDAVEQKYPWRDQTSLICRRSQKGTIRYLPYPNSAQNLALR